jgi:hypothetical protein
MVDISTAVGNTADAARYNALFTDLKGKYHGAYFDTKSGAYGSSQTSNLLPLYLNITPPALVSGVVTALADSVTTHKLGLLSGAMGTRYIFQALAQNGKAALALQIAADTEQPSFGFMALQGPAGGGLGTGTVWEHWGGNAHDYGGGSKNHPMFTGGIGVFLYQLGGLVVHDAGKVELGRGVADGSTALGAHDLVFAPGAGDLGVMRELKAASVSVRTPAGQSSIEWTYNHSALHFECSVSIPIGLQHPAELHLPIMLTQGEVVLHDLDLRHTYQLRADGHATDENLPVGVLGAFVRNVRGRREAVVQLLSGEFRLSIGQGSA